MKLVYQYMTIFFNFLSTSSHLHPLQVENCDSNSRLVVDEDDNGKLRLERVKVEHPCHSSWACFNLFIVIKYSTNYIVVEDLAYVESTKMVGYKIN